MAKDVPPREDGFEGSDSGRSRAEPRPSRGGRQMPPPFGRPPFPPFDPRFGPPPPPYGYEYEDDMEDEVEYEYYIEGEENEELDPEYEVVEEEVISSSSPPSRAVYEMQFEDEQRHGMDSIAIMQDKGGVASKLQNEGDEKAREIGKAERVTEIALKTVKICLNIFIIALLGFACFIFVKFSFDSLSEKERISGEVSQKLSSPQIFKWRLMPTQANAVAKSFYDATGTMEGFVNMVDLMLRGSIDFGGDKKAFYCIKKRDGRSFLKIGAGDEAKCYYINPAGKAWFLQDGGVAGKRVALNEKDSERIRSLVIFDDVLNQRSFPLDGNNTDGVMDSMIEYEGRIEFDGVEHECISTTDLDGRKTMFFVDISTRYISGIKIDRISASVKVVFSQYDTVEENLKMPIKREIFIDSKPYASVVLDMVVKNREMIFPQ